MPKGKSHSARSAWIETLKLKQIGPLPMSHSARSAWIETVTYGAGLPAEKGRTPQGVRGLKQRRQTVSPLHKRSHSARSAWIETTWYRLKTN